MYKEKIINIESGEEIWRDYTSEEIAEVENAQANAAIQAAESAKKEAARKAIFEKLGLTEAEAAVLLG